MGIAFNLTTKEFQAGPGISMQLVVVQYISLCVPRDLTFRQHPAKVSRFFTHSKRRCVLCNIYAHDFINCS
jgi:hypothetical protein